MAHLYRDTSVKSLYADRKCQGGKDAWNDAIQQSTTLYVGNLSFYTTEEQLYEFFGRSGKMSRIVMGLDRFSKTPCGFCFVEYMRREDAEDAMRFLNGLKLDERIVRVDWDGGFVEGRQYGRGRSGGQVRDEYRQDYDPARGGWGKLDTAPEPAAQPRRRSFVGVSRRAEPPRDLPQIRQQPPSSGEPGAKRTKTEEGQANPRFRERGAEEDDDDD